MEKKEIAANLQLSGYNCCQAVICPFAEELGVDAQTVFKLAEGFGLGMADMNGKCGALVGAVMAAGIKNSDGNLDDPKTKGSTRKIVKEMTKLFEERVGASICRQIKGVDTGTVLCSCTDCVRNGAVIVQEVLGI